MGRTLKMNIQRQIRNSWRFEHGTVTGVSGVVSTANAGKPSRTSVDPGTSDVQSGTHVLILGSRYGDVPCVIGISPWIVG